MIVDTLGNQQVQTVGPVYVDAPTTPDLIADLGYHAWTENACTLVSVDRRLAEATNRYQTLSGEQRFYTTWDTQALRLAWYGANWDSDGDLFIYLDTQPGGATRLYDPYNTPDTVIYLPGNYPAPPPPPPPSAPESAALTEALGGDQGLAPMLDTATMQADYLVWVEDGQTATLLAWDGAQWVTHQPLNADHFRVAEGRAPVYTNVRLPFASLGISDPATTPLALLAVATEEQALRPWATSPERNPVSSPLVVNPNAAQATELSFAMIRAHRWPSLASGLCPNGRLGDPPGAYADSALHFSLSAPTATAFGFMRDDLAWLWENLFQRPMPMPSPALGLKDSNHPKAADGQVITYTLRYANHGSEAATGVKVALYAWYNLTLPGSISINQDQTQYKLVEIGTIPAGSEGTITFAGVIDTELGRSRYERCRQTRPETVCLIHLGGAAVNAVVYDSRNPFVEQTPGRATMPGLEWLWGDHGVDIAPPGFVGIQTPLALIRPGVNTFEGYAYDASAVPLVRLELRTPSGTINQACPDSAPGDGRWRCQVDVEVLQDGANVDIRIQATDEHGLTSPWSAWQPLTVDTTPPTVTAQFDIPSGVVGQALTTISGQISDNRDIAAVEICREGADCQQATVQATSRTTSTMSVYDDVPAAPITIAEGATCRDSSVVRTFEVTDDFLVGDVNVGFNADHTNRDGLMVRLESPAGTNATMIFGDPHLVNPYQNWDVWLSDTATQPLHADVHDDTAAPYFDRVARPFRPLALFDGQSAQGTWKLHICNLTPHGGGAYNRSRLAIGPQSATLSPEGAWSYILPSTEHPDAVTQTLGIYGVDRAGNRTTEPVTLTYVLDQIAPTLRVTEVGDQVVLGQAQPALRGEVQDGSGQTEVVVRMRSPSGLATRVEATVVDGQWSFTPLAAAGGTYRLWVEARDVAGNVTIVGPYDVTMIGVSRVYFPIIIGQPRGANAEP